MYLLGNWKCCKTVKVYYNACTFHHHNRFLWYENAFSAEMFQAVIEYIRGVLRESDEPFWADASYAQCVVLEELLAGLQTPDMVEERMGDCWSYTKVVFF